SLTDDETNLLNALRAELMSRRFDLELRDCYYNGEQVVRDLGISIPPQLRGLHTVIGWPQIGVDALEQRLDVEAWRYKDAPDDSRALDDSGVPNGWVAGSQLPHQDCLIYGSCYAAVGSGDDAALPPLISIESLSDMTVF